MGSIFEFILIFEVSMLFIKSKKIYLCFILSSLKLIEWSVITLLALQAFNFFVPVGGDVGNFELRIFICQA